MFFTSYEFLTPEDEAAPFGEVLRFADDYDFNVVQTALMPSSEMVFGTDGQDVIIGTDETEVIHGGGGDDLIVGDAWTLGDLEAAGLLPGTDEAAALPSDPVGDVI